MRKWLRPSPGLVVAIVALFVALGGTSYAAIVTLPKASVGTVQLKTGAVTKTKISASAHFAPVIYAHVMANGKIDVARSKGITQSMVYLRETSAFCFGHLPFKVKSGSATIDYGNSGDGDSELAELQIATKTALDCETGENVEVATSSQPGTFAPRAFYVVLYG